MKPRVGNLSITQVLSVAARIQRQHFVALSAGFVAFTSLIPSSEQIQTGAASPIRLMFCLLFPLAHLTATSVVVAAQSGRVVELRRALQDGVQLYGSMLWVGVLMFGCLVPAFIFFVIPGLYLGICWLVVAAVIVAEPTRGFAALERSRALVRGYFWRTFGVAALVTVVALIVGVVVELVTKIPGVGTPLAWLLSGCASAYVAAVYAVVYFDLRARHERAEVAQQPLVTTARSAGDELAGTIG